MKRRKAMIERELGKNGRDEEIPVCYSAVVRRSQKYSLCVHSQYTAYVFWMRLNV